MIGPPFSFCFEGMIPGVFDRSGHKQEGIMELWNDENRRQTAEVRAVQVVQVFEIVETEKIEELDDQDKRGPCRGSTGFFV
jgi:hypothetical protein